MNGGRVGQSFFILYEILRALSGESIRANVRFGSLAVVMMVLF